MEPVTLVATGSTHMGTGINLAIDMVKERNRFYNQLGTPVFKPWIFMITDGEPCGESPNELETAIRRIQDEENKCSHGKLKFFALGVEGYNKEVLFRLTKRVMELRDIDFSGIFNWMSENMAAISVSRVGVAVLPENARKAAPTRDVTDW